MVRASLRTRWKARAESWRRWVAARKSGWAAASTSQCARTSAGPISALHVTRATPAKRRVWSARAARTRPRTSAERSPSRLSVSFSYSTRGTSTWMSMRSSSGPLMRFW